MNFSIIKRTVGWILLFEGLFFIVPIVTAVVYWEEEFFTFLVCAFLCAVVGGACFIGKPKKREIYAKEGFVIVALSWIIMSIFGALPFLLSGAIPSFIDALFETVSGFTTTGSTILMSKEIDGMAFYNTALDSIELPQTLEVIGEEAFMIEDREYSYTEISGELFNGG